MLSPFASLRSHDSLTNDEEQLSPIQKIFNAFCELLKADYDSSDVLDQEWSDDLEHQFDTKIINSLNKADLLYKTKTVTPRQRKLSLHSGPF